MCGVAIIGIMVAALSIGCARAPVQEMADARQAIHTAKSSGAASTTAADRLVLAERLLLQAEQALQKGDYRIAREEAMAAKEEAIKARQLADKLKGE